jgi:hypothetical protein
MVGTEQDLQQQSQLMKIGLLQIAEEVCTDQNINNTHLAGNDVVGPALYLVKLLVRQYGFDCLKKVSLRYQWVLPEVLRTTDQVCGKLAVSL